MALQCYPPNPAHLFHLDVLAVARRLLKGSRQYSEHELRNAYRQLVEARTGPMSHAPYVGGASCPIPATSSFPGDKTLDERVADLEKFAGAKQDSRT